MNDTQHWPAGARFMVRASIHLEAQHATFIADPHFVANLTGLRDHLAILVATWDALDQGAFFSIVVYEDHWDASKVIELVRTAPALTLRLIESYIQREQLPLSAAAISSHLY